MMHMLRALFIILLAIFTGAGSVQAGEEPEQATHSQGFDAGKKRKLRLYR